MDDRKTGTVSADHEPPRRRRATSEHLRLAGAALVGGVIAAFALLNFDAVEVDWIIGTWETPLIVVVVISALLGAALDRFLVLRKSRRTRRARGD